MYIYMYIYIYIYFYAVLISSLVKLCLNQDKEAKILSTVSVFFQP